MIKNFFFSLGILVLLISVALLILDSPSEESKEIGWSDLVPWTNVLTPDAVSYTHLTLPTSVTV